MMASFIVDPWLRVPTRRARPACPRPAATMPGVERAETRAGACRARRCGRATRPMPARAVARRSVVILALQACRRAIGWDRAGFAPAVASSWRALLVRRGPTPRRSAEVGSTARRAAGPDWAVIPADARASEERVPPARR